MRLCLSDFCGLSFVFFCLNYFFCDVQKLLEERIKNGGGAGMVVAIVEGDQTSCTYSCGQLSMQNPKKGR